MRNDQNYTNVITKYNKWLTNGQKTALRKRADQISLQNAKTRSEAQTSAVQNLNKTNDYLSSMGLSSNLRKAPSSGVDEESRRMPEFRQQNQALKAQEQGVLDVYGRKAAAATKAARARAAAAARKGNGLYRIVDPKTGEMMKDASGNYIWTSKKNKAAVERGETVSGINDTASSGLKLDNRQGAAYAAALASGNSARVGNVTNSINAEIQNRLARNMSLNPYGYLPGAKDSGLYSYAKSIAGTAGEAIAKSITSAFSGLTSATAESPKGNGIADAKAEQNALIKKTKAVIRASSVIQYAADVGAIPQATADIYITQVKNGTFDADKSGAYIISQISGKALDNAATNAGLMNDAVTSYVADGTPTLAQKTFYQAYARAQQTGSMDDYTAVGEAYIEVIKEQNNSQLQVARNIVLDAIDNGLNPNVGVQAIDAFKAGDTQGFLDYIDNGLVDASLQSIGNTTDSYLEQGLITEQDATSVRALIEARDAQGAVDALNAGLEARFTEQLATMCEEWHTDALTNDSVYKGDDADFWNHFDACYRVAKMSGTQEAWTRCQDAYVQLVQAEFNGQVAQAKIDANQAVKYGLSQERADAAMEAFKSGDVETYINIMNETGFEDVPIGYVAAAEKDALLLKTVGIGYATYMRYKNWSDEDITNGITELDKTDYSKLSERYQTESVLDYRQQVENGMDPDNARIFVGVSKEDIDLYEGVSTEELKARVDEIDTNSDREAKRNELIAVAAARNVDKNTQKVKEYEALTLEELDRRIEANTVKLSAPEETGYRFAAGQGLTKEEKQAIELDNVLLGYARSNKWQKQSALDYEKAVTTVVSDLRVGGDFDQVAADAYANADRANYAVQYGNGTWYYTNDEAESMLPDYMKDFSADRPIITADKFSELGWTGSNDGYFNAQVFKRADGKYVVMSTVTKGGVPMTPAWAMRYQDKLSNGSDPDGMQLGVYATKEEAEAAAQEADLTAANYVDRTAEFEGTEKVEGDAASALGVFKALSDPALIWYAPTQSNMNDVKHAAALFPEDSGTMGQLYLSSKEAIGDRRMNAVAREAKNLGADTISSAYNWYAYATDDEKKLLAYYISTDLEAAGDYFKKVNPYINERVMNNVAEVASAASGVEVRDENGKVVQEASPLLYVASKAGTYLLKPVEAAGGLYTLYQTVTGEDVDQNSKWFLPTVWNNSVRNAQYNALQAKFDAKYGKEAGQSKLGKCAVFAVQTLDSVVDSWVSAHLGQGIAEGAIGQAISLTGMGLNATASTTKELLDAGVPQDMAKRLGIMAGIFEALFEVVSLDKIVHGADDLTKSAIKRITIGGVVEGSEEMFTEAANLAASSWVLGYSSDYNKEIAELMTGGMSYSAAASKATMNQAMGVLIAGAGGFLSGGLSGTTNAIRADINTTQTGAAIRDAGGANTLIDTAQNSTDAEVKKAWSAIAAGYETNKNISNLDLGRLNYAIAMSDAKSVTGKIDSMVDDGLIEASDAKAIKEYVNGVYENSAHGMASTVYGFNLDTTALEGVSETAIAAVSKAVYETTEGRTPAQSTVKTEVTAETATEILQQDIVKEETVHGVNVVHHTTSELSATDKAKIKFAEAMAKVSGLELVVHDTLPINGVLADGKLNVALDTDRGFVSTVAHELTHWLKNNASNESYNALVDFLTNEANKARRDGFNELVEKKMVEYRDLHPNVTEEQLRQIATDETVATLCETMLNDETFVRELIQKDRNLFEKIYEWINSVLNQFRNILASDKDIRGIKEAERMVQDMETARDLWYKALQEAKAVAGEEGDTMFSKKDTRTAEQAPAIEERTEEKVLESTIPEAEPANIVVENTTAAEQKPSYSTMNPSGDINGVPVYDIRKTASENLNTAETEETKAVEQFGKDSVEAEEAAKKADEAYVAEQEARKESLRNTFGLTAEEYEEDMRYEAEQNEAKAEAKRKAAEDREAVLDSEVERARADVKEKVAERQWTESDKRDQDKRIAKLQKNVDYWQNRYDNEQDVQAKKKKIGYKLRDAQDALARAMRTRERMNRNGRVAPRPTDAGTPDLDTAAASIVEEERTVIDENGNETKTSVPEVIEKILLGVKRVAQWPMKAPEKMIDAVSGKNTELKEILNDLIQRPLNEAGSRYTKNLIARKGQFDAEMRRLGIVGDKSKAGIEMTRKKSAAIQKYGEGFYYNAEGERISYTLDDLKQEFPEDWQSIVQAEQYCRDVYDDYHDMYNSMLEKIYPDVIEHLETDAKKLQAMVDEETAKRNNQLKLVGELEAKLEENRTLLASEKSGTQVYATLENQIVSIQAQLENAQHLAELYEHKAQLRARQRDAILKGIETGDLVRNRRLMRRNDYYHHFTKQQEGLARLRQIWYEEESDIDPMLVGKTDQTNPRKGYVGFAQKRLGEKTEYDAIKGMHLYMNEIEKRLAYDPVASHYKTMIDQLRKHGSAGLESGQLKDANDLIRWLEEERNQIVGKSSMIDRKVSDWGIAPRKFIKVMQWLNSRDRSNRVLGNLRSAIVQASNLTNAMLYVTNLSDWSNAIRNMIASYTNSSVGEMMRDTVAQSEFIQQRYNLEDLEYDEKEISPKQIALKMLGALDQFAGKLMWWAAYNQYNAAEEAKKNGTKNRGLADTGRTYRNAIEYADDITRRSTAGRGIGELAPAMTSSVVNLLSPFQVEVNNTWQNYKKAIGDKNYKGLMAFSLLTYVMNELGQFIYKDRSLPFDIIDALVSAIEGAFGDDDNDEEEKTTLSRVGNYAKLFGQNTASTFMNGIPMKSLLDMFAGETIAEITGTEASTPNVLGASTVVESAKGVLDFVKKAAKGQINSVDEAWTLALQDSDWLNLVLPWGGAQAQRTLKGLDAAIRGYSQRMNNEGELEAQFPVEGKGDKVRSAVFGKWATEGGRAYFDGDARALDAETTARMKEAQKTGMSPVDFFKSLAELKAVTGEKDADGKPVVTKSSAQFSALAESEMTDEQMQLMLDSLGKTNAMRDRYNADDSGIGVSTFLSYAADYGDKTDLAEDESQTTAFLKRVADDENLTDAQKIAMTQIVLGSNSKNAAAKMSAASAAGVSISNLVKYDKMAADKDGKLQALMDDTTMNASEKSALYKVLYPDGKERDFTNQALFELSGRSDEMVARGKVAIANGVPGEKVNEYYAIKGEKDTDPETGASTSIGKEAVLTQLFEDTSLTAEQKDVLATALYPNGKKRDWSSRSMFELSGMTDNEYSKAKVAISNGVPATKALEYLKVTKETKYDAATGHTSKIGKDAVLERVMADKNMTPKQKLAVEVMLYPTDSKRRDYTNADWFYLSSTSSGTEGKAYKCAKQAVEAGIPLSACVAETKEYLRMKAAGEGSGKNGGMTQKDTKKICYRLGLTDRQAAIMFKIYK